MANLCRPAKVKICLGVDVEGPMYAFNGILIFFCPMPPPHVLVDFVVLPPGHGSNVTDF